MEILAPNADASKVEKQRLVLNQVNALIEGEPSTIANLANTSALLKEVFDYWWVGFYLVDDEELVLGPFQGPVACTRIAKGKGVCGSAWQNGETTVVPNVDEFPGHIACSSESKSEVVCPIFLNNTVVAVLDVDSNKLDDFDSADVEFLQSIAQTLGKAWS